MIMTEQDLIIKLNKIYDDTSLTKDEKREMAQKLCSDNYIFLDGLRSWQKSNFAQGNLNFSQSEKLNAEHLHDNDNWKNIFQKRYSAEPNIFEERYLRDIDNKKVYRIFSPNFRYLVELKIPKNKIGGSKRVHMSWCDKELKKNVSVFNLSDFDKEYIRKTKDRPYDTYWHHDSVYGRMLLVKGGDHLTKRKNGMYAGLNVKHEGGFSLWQKLHLDDK